ncbi:urease accessory protein UreD [Halomonas urumqiensis]|uniref:Urease accessory protein UreD n=1 Tax=Halomonas urumqiensis TaxID=1684789 RepID=A0A2N7UFV0_9GAMM|nr:urease accessory protein UreD [Halomonas urumqiensis]PMR79285.1 urease accessory protein [Halomonas urumqiensis]PTB03958.1 urease accessory protein UreD [Halomonas urumqiensis]GHE19788.1 urease accessory protein UreD 2 [Halomonas urumqiensis]
MTAIPRAIPEHRESGHRFDADRHWAASLSLAFEPRGGVTRMTRSRHQGPLRVQRPFHPEGADGACHVYLLHPPGGLVSGDALTISARVASGARALLTTPAANKLYKADSHGVAWSQHTHLIVDDGGILEWLPQETIAFDGSRGEQYTTIDITGTGRCLGWEVMALGRPASHLPYVSGRIEQRFQLIRDGQPLWLERQPLDPAHRRFQGRWGQGGATVQATLWAVGVDDEPAAIEALRETLPASPRWAVTVRHGVLLLRYLGGERNDAWALCQRAWEVLRPRLAGRDAHVPRIWLT